MVLAIVQARMTSSRLPGKVLKPLAGEPMLFRQLERIARAKLIDKTIVATSTDKSDDAIMSLCEDKHVECFRGNLTDVLDRFYQAALASKPTSVVRLCGDSPLTDPTVIDRGIELFLSENSDYITNSVNRTYPVGLDMEVLSFRALEAAWQESTRPEDREHVTPFIRRHPDRFLSGNFYNNTNLSHLRWTVDEPEDFQFVSAVYDTLYNLDPEFTTSDVLKLLADRPELTKINAHLVHDGLPSVDSSEE